MEKLDRKTKREILIQIGDLIHNHCRQCTYANNQRYCMTKCEIGEQLKAKGLILDGGVQRQKDFNAETQQKRSSEEQIEMLRRFFELREQGLSHAAARRILKVASETVYGWVDRHGDLFELTPKYFKRQGKHLADQEQIAAIGKYLEYRRDGKSHQEASEELSIKKDRMYTFLRKWGHVFPDTEKFYKYNPR